MAHISFPFRSADEVRRPVCGGIGAAQGVQPPKTDPPKMKVIRLPPPCSVWRSAGQIPLGGEVAQCAVRVAFVIPLPAGYQHIGFMNRLELIQS